MDKRLTSLLELIKKTGDRLVVFDASSDAEPFVIMDLASYNKLRESQGVSSRTIVSNAVAMAEDMDLWEKTKRDINSPQMSSEQIIASEPTSASAPSTEMSAMTQETEANTDDKYYFEEIDANES